MFSWWYVTSSKSMFIEGKVKNALSSSVDAISPKTPRIKFTDENTGEVSYTPNFFKNYLPIEENTLLQLNQDMSVPPLKITNFNVIDMGGNLKFNLTIKYQVAFGINKTIDIYSNVRAPKYKSKS